MYKCPNCIFIISSFLRCFHTPISEYIFFFLQYFINDHRNAFYSNCVPENDAVRNVVN